MLDNHGPHAVQLACVLVKDRFGEPCKVLDCPGSVSKATHLTEAGVCASWLPSCCSETADCRYRTS